ncbi:hypothetical protein TSAR_011078 [Trichomalopsis sarcophagae]|uniref:Lysosome-associated membrane glycoprotein 5 n=1 Tax=Trichomalopsis sarcophagae TaxID=543379 RepID=A0A232ENN0_9HYME|nr:hypothetical protein TSAR_011078 [Trichomalopsis sarcophagae]
MHREKPGRKPCPALKDSAVAAAAAAILGEPVLGGTVVGREKRPVRFFDADHHFLRERRKGRPRAPRARHIYTFFLRCHCTADSAVRAPAALHLSSGRSLVRFCSPCVISPTRFWISRTNFPLLYFTSLCSRGSVECLLNIGSYIRFAEDEDEEAPDDPVRAGISCAQEKAEDNGSFDSKLKVVGFFNKPALSVNARKSRAIDSKLAVESESPSGHDSLPLVRGTRSAEDSEDNETVVATTSLPLENDDFTPNYAEVESDPITTADPESSEKDKAAGDNTGMPNSTPTPIEVADNDEDEVKAEHHQAVSSSEELPATQASEHEASSSEGVPAIQALSEPPAPSFEDVQGRSVSDIEALEQMHPDLAPSSSPSQDIDVQPSASFLDVNESTPTISSPASGEREEDAPVPPSPPASEEHEEGTPVPSVSPTSEEQAPPAAASEESKPESDVNQDLETSTLINVADPTSDDASAEKTSPSEETTEEIEDNFPNLETSENENIDEVTTEDDEDDGTTDATFEEPTGSPADGESTEETVPTAPESSVANSTSSTPAPSSKYDFLVYDESNVACILASMSITLRVTYTTKDKKTRTKSIQVPSTASVSGFCGEKDSNMTLSWPTSDTSLEQKDSITFMMKKDDSKFYVNSLQVSLVPNDEDFPNVIGESLRGNSATDLRLFSAHLKNGAHVCRPMTEVTCGQIVVLIKDVSLIAYNDRDSLAGREEERCSPPPKSISIAAVVGAIVGLTVTIGIVASYAWYRKRTSTFRSELP